VLYHFAQDFILVMKLTDNVQLTMNV